MTTTTRHTPAPWRADDDGIVMAREVDGPVQAWGSVAKTIGTMDPATKTANASLIAAAPDLLAALRACLSVVPYGNESIDAAARAAIAKATMP